MADSTLRVVRRSKGSRATSNTIAAAARTALTAASQPVTDVQAAFRSVIGVGGRNEWQTEAWDMYDAVGELRYVVGWRASSCAQVRLVASEVGEDGVPTGSISEDAGTEGQKVADIVRDIAGGPLGQAKLIHRVAECLTVPGELFVAIITVTEKDGTSSERWVPLTRDEITATPNGSELELPDGTKHKYTPPRDSMFRVWNPRARRAREADSPVRACLDPLREIVRTSKKIRSAGKSRLIGNGILVLPEEMSLPSSRGPTAAGQPGDPFPVNVGQSTATKVQDMLFAVAKVAIEDEESQAAHIPLILTAAADAIKDIKHHTFGSDVTDVEIKTRNDAIARLAMGLDVSPERLLGIGSQSNHWSAWQIGDEDVRLHIKPVLETLCDAIQREVLDVVFAREGIDRGKYVIWYDASQLTADPDLTDEAENAHESGAMRNEPYLRALGLPEDSGYDLTTLEGFQEFARDAVIRDPSRLQQYLPILALAVGELEEMDFPTPAAIAPPAPDDAGDDDPADAAPETEDDAEQQSGQPATVAASATPNAQEMVLVERMLVHRALDMAGKRRVNTHDPVLRARLRNVAPSDYHRLMEPVAESDIDKLTRGWDDVLADEAIARLGAAVTDRLRAAVRAKVRHELTRPVVNGAR